MSNPLSSLLGSDSTQQRLRRRHRAECRFRWYGRIALGFAFIALMVLLVSVFTKGSSAFWQTRVVLPITFEAALVDPEGTLEPEVLRRANYGELVREALREAFPDVSERKELRQLYTLVSLGAPYQLREMVMDNPQIIGQTVEVPLLAASDVDMFIKGLISKEVVESDRRLKDNQISWVEGLEQEGRVETVFNWHFFSEGDSREPEQAGVLGSIVGSVFLILACLAVSFPLAVATAIYLEEFAPVNVFTDIIEVNINNLAAVPSIIYGLLGLAAYLSFMELPRSSALVGGLTLSLMILPTIIISTRVAIQAIPDSIRDAARGLGASPMQVVLHHVLPLAMPGIMTGTILGIARALGETAPLLMIGMVAFVADVPQSFTDPATAMPVQVFLWADSPELGFAEKTAAAILVLLAFLIAISAFAVYIRKKFEHRW